jgi:hypothetical protein
MSDRDSVPTLTLRLLGPFSLGTSSCPQGVRIGRKGQALLTSVAAQTGVAATLPGAEARSLGLDR